MSKGAPLSHYCHSFEKEVRGRDRLRVHAPLDRIFIPLNTTAARLSLLPATEHPRADPPPAER
jgi:hypothetical protein